MGGGGEHVKFYPYEKGGWKKFEVVLKRELEVLAIVRGGGRKKFPP